MEDPKYRIDESRIISEMLDGETIIIDFKNGSYYSLNNTGSVLWEKIREGYTKDQLLQYLKGRFDASPDLIEKSALTLLAQLIDLSLLVEETASSDLPSVEVYSGTKQEFYAFALQQFQDMQEMLLADPIHDVDETGWPALKR